MKEASLALGFLETESIQIRPSEPFRLASGRLSPVYVDCRRLISFPKWREIITTSLVRMVQEEIGLPQIDVIAGGETAGIAYAAFVAQALRKPMIYVRKEPKGYGKSSQIEGVLTPGQRVLLVEDLVTDGGSKLNFKRGIENAGGIVRHCLCVFEYFSEEAGLHRAREILRENGIELHALVNWDDVLSVVREQKTFTEQEVATVLQFFAELAT
ncbi:orotate phosphoribosyltransferase [Candidatus Acetothermia bacterium]|nr:orotate phosphoribosyltransferase [Candidatus Acetothermia bacterium]MCI2431218.1 orotate phosphoribosyltransferase [Candidatus Acetothermia bacterium]MCI2436831.1 orotate phosphoribosyltransferase [Candidatus Acetothermia bacterium]